MSASQQRTETYTFAPPASNGKRRPTNVNTSGTRHRRKSSSLGADPRGDTGANALATSNLKQNTPPLSPTTPHAPKEKGRKRRKAKNVLRRFKRSCLKHTWLVPLLLSSTILALYFLSPGEHNPLHPLIFLSYANPPLNERTSTLPAHIGDVTQYGKGPLDFLFVGFYTVVLSFTREFLMQRLIRPIALHYRIRNRGKQARFMEQFYTAMYFAIFGPFGLFVMSRTPVWYFNTAGMYEGFPHRAHEGYFKAYYLLQASYWAQQAIVLCMLLEKPRKDFKELVLHHIVTLSLIGLSYRFHFTYMGVAVYITHDISDFFLATSKVLNYLDASITPPYFVLFMGIWAYMRHFLNLRILYSLFPYDLGFSRFGVPPNEFATIGRYDLTWEDQQYKCWISQAITFSLLAVLQAVNVFWFILITRILLRFVFVKALADERSEDEDELDEKAEEIVEGKGAEGRGEWEGKQMNGNVRAGGLGPKVVLNGHPVDSSEAPQARMNIREKKATLRKR